MLRTMMLMLRWVAAVVVRMLVPAPGLLCVGIVCLAGAAAVVAGGCRRSAQQMQQNTPATPNSSPQHHSSSAAAATHGNANVNANARANVTWPFWPRRLRIHPATRVVTDQATGELVIEARVEFFDAEGDTSKAYGELTLQLHNPAQSTGDDQTWKLDLRNLADNRRQFDDVTHTYLLRLDLDSDSLPPQAELRAIFISADGQTMEGRMRLRR